MKNERGLVSVDDGGWLNNRRDLRVLSHRILEEPARTRKA